MSPEVAEEIRQLEILDQDFARGIAQIETPRAPRTMSGGSASWRFHDGSKFTGGFGPTQLLTPDYWTLRARSAQLFATNLYARGIIRRFVTNVINVGLHLESIPDEMVLGLEEDALADWSELVENRWRLWETSARLCDQREQETFGALQAAGYAEALIAGDILVTLQQDARTGLPRVRLIRGEAVQSPLRPARAGNRIVHGVELDAQDRHVAYWIRQRDGTAKRLPAWGEKSGRRLAWLVYGTEKRLDDVRGEPILSLVLQSLKEIDRYRDAVQRKAVINSMLALFIKKNADKMGTLPLSGGAVRREVVTDTGPDGSERTWTSAEQIPGLVLEELQVGEEPVGFDAKGVDEKFGDFEESIVQAFAWALETPPEILRLAFSNNYSASQAAINEYKMFLNRARTAFGDAFCAPIYVEWLLSESLLQKLQTPGLLDAWRDPARYDVFGAWVLSDWAGQIKPAVDLSKLVRGYEQLIELGLITRDRAARELTGMKFSKIVKRLRIENEQLRVAHDALGLTSSASSPPSPVREDEEDEDEGKAA